MAITDQEHCNPLSYEASGGTAEVLRFRTGEEVRIEPQETEGERSYGFGWSTDLDLQGFVDAMREIDQPIEKVVANGQFGLIEMDDLPDEVRGELRKTWFIRVDLQSGVSMTWIQDKTPGGNEIAIGGASFEADEETAMLLMAESAPETLMPDADEVFERAGALLKA